MKTSYELAMERLGKASPQRKLTDDQKRRLAEIETECKARLADREIAIQMDLRKAAAAGDLEAARKLEEQWQADRRRWQDEMEQKKQQVRDEA